MLNRVLGQKIIILGCSGSGKSTFARALAAKTGLPLVHLDNVWWRADGTHVSREEFDRALAALLQDERWILDGDYSRTYEVRIQAADTVVFLDYPESVWQASLETTVPPKFLELNRKAFRLGRES